MGTKLQYNNQTDDYEAVVDNHLVSVDSDIFEECRQTIMCDIARMRGYALSTLPDKVYNQIYDEAREEVENAEWWMDGYEGVTITPIANA